MTDSELHEGLVRLVKTERGITAEIISHIAEVDRRRLYLPMGFTSLFGYLTSLGYPPASAQRRIDAARLSREVPVLEKLQNGELNLTQISILAQGFRRKEVSSEVKSDLVAAIQNQDIKQTEIAVHQILDLPVVVHDKKHFQQDESVRVEITFSKEQWQILSRVKEVISHSLPNPPLPALIERLAESFLKKHDPTSERKSRRVTNSSGIRAIDRRAVFRRDQVCQWRLPDGRVCGSRFQAQIDHRVARSAGGTHEFENLQVLCGVHNRLKYELENTAV